jgi:hypothetical protein
MFYNSVSETSPLRFSVRMVLKRYTTCSGMSLCFIFFSHRRSQPVANFKRAESKAPGFCENIHLSGNFLDFMSMAFNIIFISDMSFPSVKHEPVG